MSAVAKPTLFVLWVLKDQTIPILQKEKPMTESTAAGRNQLTSPEDRGIMLLANKPVNLDNVNNALPTVQADREYTSPSGCHVKMFFRKEHDPGIRKEIARLLLTAFEQEGNDENETSHVSVQSIDEGTGR